MQALNSGGLSLKLFCKIKILINALKIAFREKLFSTKFSYIHIISPIKLILFVILFLSLSLY